LVDQRGDYPKLGEETNWKDHAALPAVPGMPDVYFVTKRNIVSNFGAVSKVVALKLEKTHDIIGFCKTKNVVCIWDSNHDYPQIHHAGLTLV
jgi:hypothetical protein